MSLVRALAALLVLAALLLPVSATSPPLHVPSALAQTDETPAADEVAEEPSDQTPATTELDTSAAVSDESATAPLASTPPDETPTTPDAAAAPSPVPSRTPTPGPTAPDPALLARLEALRKDPAYGVLYQQVGGAEIERRVRTDVRSFVNWAEAETAKIRAARATPTPVPVPLWAKYGFTVRADKDLWPALEVIHAKGYDWILTSLSTSLSGEPIRTARASLPPGLLGLYNQRSILISRSLQNVRVEVTAAVLVHETMHLRDDLAGRWVGWGDACYNGEVRAYEAEAGFWKTLWGENGRPNPDDHESGMNNLVLWFTYAPERFGTLIRQTPTYTKECAKPDAVP